MKTPVTHEQRQWKFLYESETGFDLLYEDLLNTGEISFEEFAQKNIAWYESYASDVHLRIGNYPTSDEYWDKLIQS